MRDLSRRQGMFATLGLLAGCAHRQIRFGQPINPADPALNGSLTRARADALWGRSDDYTGPQWEYVSYPQDGVQDGRVLLWFQPVRPYQLRRVLVADLSGLPGSGYRVALNLIPETESRTADQIPTRRPLFIRDVARVWGPVDGRSGSGVVWWHYALADGGHASLGMSYRRAGLVEDLRVVSADGKHERDLIDPERYERLMARDRKEARLRPYYGPPRNLDKAPR